MNAGYVEPEVRLEAGSRTLRVVVAVRNHSAAAWRPGEGFGIGYHLFDAATDTLIVDGARIHPERDVKPGETLPVRLEISLPGEDGDYQVLVSPMREGVCWYYEQGWPFLLVEAATRDGVPVVKQVRVATQATLARERALRSLGCRFHSWTG